MPRVRGYARINYALLAAGIFFARNDFEHARQREYLFFDRIRRAVIARRARAARHEFIVVFGYRIVVRAERFGINGIRARRRCRGERGYFVRVAERNFVTDRYGKLAYIVRFEIGYRRLGIERTVGVAVRRLGLAPAYIGCETLDGDVECEHMIDGRGLTVARFPRIARGGGDLHGISKLVAVNVSNPQRFERGIAALDGYDYARAVIFRGVVGDILRNVVLRAVVRYHGVYFKRRYIEIERFDFIRIRQIGFKFVVICFAARHTRKLECINARLDYLVVCYRIAVFIFYYIRKRKLRIGQYAFGIALFNYRELGQSLYGLVFVEVDLGRDGAERDLGSGYNEIEY